MEDKFTFMQFLEKFPDDDLCLEEIKRRKYPGGINCSKCNRITTHYRLTGRKAYACKFCREQTFPLKDTIFEKTTTSLRLWFYCMFVLTQTRAKISVKELQKELGVTYKTAWRMYNKLHFLMQQRKGDLLFDPSEKIHKWLLFNTFEIKVVQKAKL